METTRQDFGLWMSPQEDFEEDIFVSGYAAELELGSYRFSDFFKDTRPYIIESDSLPGIARALAFLPLIFQRLIDQETPFLASEFQFIIKWLCSRLSNASNDPTSRAGTEEVIDAVRVLSQSESFTESHAVEVVEALFALEARLTYKDLKTNTRVNILQLLQQLFSRYNGQFSRTPGINGFVKGFTDLTQFEKTPKCLGVLFKLFYNMTKTWEFDLDSDTATTEKLFNSFYRYFPIDVKRAASHDPSVPTLDDLASALEDCMTSSPVYANFAFELLLNNLDADQTEDSKKKTLSMILSCVSIYPPAVLQIWEIKIWNSLKFEIWQAQSEDIVKGSLRILQQVCTGLSREGPIADEQKSSLARYIKHVGDECDAKSQDSMQYLVANGRILHALATSTPRALIQITKTYIPRKHVQWQALTLAKEKGYLLQSLTEIVRAHTEVHEQFKYSDSNDDLPKALTALQACHSQIDSIYQEALDSENDLVKTAVEGLSLLLGIPSFFPSNADGDKAIESIITVLTKTAHEDTKAQCVAVLQKISARQPAVYLVVLDELFSQLPPGISDEYSSTEGYKSIKGSISIFETSVAIGCSEVCQQPLMDSSIDSPASSYWHTNLDSLVHRLLIKLNDLVVAKDQYDFAHLVLLAISRALTRFEGALHKARAEPNIAEPEAEDPLRGPYTDLVMSLFRTLAPFQQRHGQYAHTSEVSWYTYLEHFPGATTQQLDRIVKSVGEITLQCLCSSSTNDQNNFLLQWNRQNTDCSALSSLFTKDPDLVDGCDFLMLDEWQCDVRRGPPEKCLANVLAMYMVAGSRPQHRAALRVPFFSAVKHMMKGYIGFDIEAPTQFREGNSFMSPLSRQSMLWYIQLLVNKFGVATEDGVDGKTALDVLELYVGEARSLTGQTIMSAERHIRVLQVLAYFTAAALHRGDKYPRDEGFRMLTNCLEDAEPYGQIAARLFRVMLEPSPIMTKENFCYLRPIAPVYILENIIPRLISKWRESQDTQVKANYLVALSTLLEFLDQAQYIPNPGQGEQGNGGKKGENAEPREPLLPAILSGLSLPDAPAKVVLFHSLKGFITHNSTLVTQHLHTIVRSLKNLLSSNTNGDAKVRIAGVDILKSLMNAFEKEILVKQKEDIEACIQMAVQDESPEVRRKGTEAGSLWGCLQLGEDK